MHTVYYCNMCSVQCTVIVSLYNVLSTLHCTVIYALCTALLYVHCVLHCYMSTVHCTSSHQIHIGPVSGKQAPENCRHLLTPALAQCTVYSVQPWYSAQCTVYTVQPWYSVWCTALVKCTLHSVHITICSVQLTLYSVWCTPYSIHCTL